jgi:hypothetical protein
MFVEHQIASECAKIHGVSLDILRRCRDGWPAAHPLARNTITAVKIMLSMAIITAFFGFWTVTYAVTKNWCRGHDMATQSDQTPPPAAISCTSCQPQAAGCKPVERQLAEPVAKPVAESSRVEKGKLDKCVVTQMLCLLVSQTTPNKE